MVLDVLEDKQKGSSTDWSDFLCQIILSLPLGQTHAQQVSHNVSIIKEQYHLSSWVGLSFHCNSSSDEAVLLG